MDTQSKSHNYKTSGSCTSGLLNQMVTEPITLLKNMKDNPDEYSGIGGIRIQNKKILKLMGRKRNVRFICYYEGDGTDRGEIVKIDLLDRNNNFLGILWEIA